MDKCVRAVSHRDEKRKQEELEPNSEEPQCEGTGKKKKKKSQWKLHEGDIERRETLRTQQK